LELELETVRREAASSEGDGKRLSPGLMSRIKKFEGKDNTSTGNKSPSSIRSVSSSASSDQRDIQQSSSADSAVRQENILRVYAEVKTVRK
jgi:hypothetical protein